MYNWNGEADAERFVRTYADLILRLCLSHGLNRADAQDICQDLFLKLLTQRRAFRSAEHEKAFVIRAAGNACKNLLRAPHRSRAVPLDEALSAAAGGKSPVLDAVRALPERYRAAAELTWIEGYSPDEAARLLGISPAALRKRIERARKQLKTELKGVLI
ncbi:MAG: RNA polymerase sigma factor [Agathobaculum sp.]|jgi:RNA polymerase sigma factor (sigma-70 family)|uniref:RNA polymerase sigma factor n=1 Tax=Agathobaculum sp. TaxID=2048138 RepID=UPI003D9367C3